MRRLFLATFCVVALLTKTTPDASQSRLGTIESIVERGTYRLDDSTFINTIDKVRRDGHYYSHQPPLLSALEAPVYWALHLSGARFHNRGRFLMTWAFTLLTNGLALSLTVLVFANILTMAGVPPPLREALALLLPMGTWLLPYGLVANNHGISGLLVTVLIWLLLKIEWQGATPVRALAIGNVLGLLAAIEILPLVSFVPVAAVELFLRRDFGGRLRVLFISGLAAPLVAHAALNIPITGDVIPAGFHTEMFRFEGSGFEESSLTGTLKHDSIAALASYAWQSLFAGKGFFVFAPLCFLGALSGVLGWRWWRSRAVGTHAVLMISLAISLAVSLLMTNNFGGGSVGFRHAAYLSPAFAVLVLPWIAREATRRRRNVVTIVAGASVLLLFVYAAREPWSPLTVSAATIGAWDQYLPLAGRIARGDLLIP
ncbi:MAG TPA: hypothetical protein VEA16_17710 [Vicinamibacterales bacterium]|nr:hypothetical protein [Vicinamibacterales bacterium]